jgi:hypothetical protein
MRMSLWNQKMFRNHWATSCMTTNFSSLTAPLSLVIGKGGGNADVFMEPEKV